MSLPQIDPVEAAVLKLVGRLRVVESEALPLASVAGRVLARPLLADRDHPPLNVSAMDGYALRIADAIKNAKRPMRVMGVAMAGAAAPELPADAAVQIFTGAPVPREADCVVPREQTVESPGQVRLANDPSTLKQGQNIRFRSENALAGSEVLPAGTWLSSAAMAGVASVASSPLHVQRRALISIINTGDELMSPGEPVTDWQIRDSNGPTLTAALEPHTWLEIQARSRVPDQLAAIAKELALHLETADAVVLTGGVSMGDTDHVPAAIEAVGGEIVFHRLPIRPGKPVLGAVTTAGKLIIGLPGNPVSVAVTAAAIALPLLRHIAGFAQLMPSQPRVLVTPADDKQLNLQWYRLIEFSAAGEARYVESRGSGDLIALSRSAGFITLPAGMSGAGPWPLRLW